MRNIKKLNPKKITKNGFYFDLDGLGVFRLTEEEILASRKHFHNRRIASNVYIAPKYKLERKNKYQGRAKFRKNLNTVKNVALTTAAVTVILYMGTKLYDYVESPQMEVVQVEVQAIPALEKETAEESEFVTINELVEEEPVQDPESYQKEILKRYCDIYQVDYQCIYDKIVEMTNHFSSPEYLSGTIPGITCKGEAVQASSEEELLLCFVRHAKQLPETLGFDQATLYVSNGYVSREDYGKTIGYFSSLLAEDPGIIFSIVQAETSFNSDLFLHANNPAGLKTEDGSWWVFSTKEEGFIELILQVKAYQRKGASSMAEIGAIHAPTEDNNEGWLDNALETYSELQGRYEEVFGVSYDKNKVL